jgi:hypothetical protein
MGMTNLFDRSTNPKIKSILEKISQFTIGSDEPEAVYSQAS